MKTKHQPILSAPVAHGGHQKLNNPIRRTWFALAVLELLFISVFALLPSSAQAGCSQWDVSGQWTIYQGHYTIPLALSQNGKKVSGTASQVYHSISLQGQVTGTVEGDSFDVQINWAGGGAGIYRGTIGRKGKVNGTTYDKNNPSSTAAWSSDSAMRCADVTQSKSAPAPATGPISPAPPAVSPGWAGRWETRTAKGGHFEIIFVQDGDNVRGALTDLNGNPQYNGSLIGEVSGNVLLYEYTQPEIEATGKGMFELASSGRTITGSGVANDAARTKFKWWGWKTN